MYNVLDYGAVADKNTLNTEAIQKAIDDCNANGGGTVFVPAGEYVTGTIFLKSNVELHLEHGATLFASTDLNDYNELDAYEQNFSSAHEKWLGKHLIIAVEVKNVAISGNGVIDAAGDFFFDEPQIRSWCNGYVWRYGFTVVKDENLLRPGQVICFIECENVKVTDITIKNAPCWAYFFHGCDYVQVRGIKVLNPPTFANTDGIDIDCCRYVTVSDCIIRTGDDGITLRCASKKLKNYKPCEFVTIQNCVIRASACGMRIGVGAGEIRNARISNLVVEDAGTCFGVQSTYGKNCNGRLENIDISNVTCHKSGKAILVNANNVGYIKNVTFSNMKLTTYTGCTIEAQKDVTEVKNIVLRDIDLTIEHEDEGFVETELSKKYKRDHVINVLNTDGVILDNVRVFAKEKATEGRKGVLLDENNTNFEVKNSNLEYIFA